MPGDKELSVIRIQFLKLRAVYVYIFRCSVERRIPIPGRTIESQLHPKLLAGKLVLLNHITLSILPWTFRDVMFCCLRRPDAQAVVVLSHHNHTLEASG